jgi:hypothetical protein
MADNQDPQSRLWDELELAERLDIPRETVAKWRRMGVGPDFLRLGKHVRYSPGDVAAWLATRRNVPKGA